MLFNTRMVKAILEGRKTVTRRLMRPEEAWACENNGDLHFRVQKGDVLWARETWAFWPCVTCGERDTCAEKPASMETADGETEGCFLYRADGETPIFRSGQIWRPSIHMPRQAARIFLQVTEVRAERLREITEEEARREGCGDPKRFPELWDNTIKNRAVDGWFGNPWVWVIRFERCEAPES